MSRARTLVLTSSLALAVAAPALGQAGSAPPPSTSAAPVFDAALARRLGADARGMRNYVLVILKTGPNRIPAGPERDEMFKGHFSNMERLSKAGKLAVAGPFGTNDDGWRGLYIFAVADVEEARTLVATDPVVAKGEMVPEFHPWYGTAALLTVPETHERLVKADR